MSSSSCWDRVDKVLKRDKLKKLDQVNNFCKEMKFYYGSEFKGMVAFTSGSIVLVDKRFIRADKLILRENWLKVKEVKLSDRSVVIIIFKDKPDSQVKLYAEENAEKIYMYITEYLTTVTASPPIFLKDGIQQKLKGNFQYRPDIYLALLLNNTQNEDYVNKVNTILLSHPKRISTKDVGEPISFLETFLEATNLDIDLDTIAVEDVNDRNIIKESLAICNFIEKNKERGIQNNKLRTFEFINNKPLHLKAFYKAIKDSGITKLSFTNQSIIDKNQPPDDNISIIFSLIGGSCITDLEFNEGTFESEEELNMFLKRMSGSEHINELTSLKVTANFEIDVSNIYAMKAGLMKLEINSHMLTLDHALKIIDQKPTTLNELILDNIKGYIKTAPGFFISKKFDVFGIRDSDWNSENLFAVVNACFDYQYSDITIDFSGIKMPEKEWNSFFNKVKDLRSPYITGIIWDRNIVCQEFLQMVMNCPRLKTLSVKNYKTFPGKPLLLFTDLIEKTLTLEELIMPNGYNEIQFSKLLNSLQNNKTIKYVDISDNEVNRQQLTELNQLLERNKFINHINFAPSEDKFKMDDYYAILNRLARKSYKFIVDWPSKKVEKCGGSFEDKKFEAFFSTVKLRRNNPCVIDNGITPPKPPAYAEEGIKPSTVSVVHEIHPQIVAEDSQNPYKNLMDDIPFTEFDSTVNQLIDNGIIKLPEDDSAYASKAAYWKEGASGRNDNKTCVLAPPIPDICTEYLWKEKGFDSLIDNFIVRQKRGNRFSNSF